jgi:3-(3-hydroxy-phenyl)propionate hydroxylase
MYQPDTAPRRSLYFDYEVFPFVRPPELDGPGPAHEVAIVGAGPIGLCLGLDLAQRGVRCVLLGAERQLSEGSRALAFTRRSLEILQQVGVGEQAAAAGLPWRHGNSFFRGQRVYRLDVPHEDDDRFAPLTNLQQQVLEQMLHRRALREPRLEIRWGHKVVGLERDEGSVRLRVDTEAGEYTLAAGWAVACDGARSTLRQALGLRMEGASYEGRFVIADIRCELGLPTERLAFFDPPWNPGNTMLMHRSPQGLWRVDFQLPAGESPEEALQPARLKERIDAQLAMIGRAGTPWEMDWCSVYSARAMTLPDYVHGRVLFCGDAAHLLPIFGVRGANTGFQDAQNLGWKLAAAVQGWAGPGLLPSYTHERVGAAREIIDEATRSTRFMTPPTRGFRLLRDAVLQLSLSQDYPRPLMNWRTSRPHHYHDSPLNPADDDSALVDAGPGPGAPMRNLRFGPDDFLFDRLGLRGFLLFVFDRHPAVPGELGGAVRALRRQGVPIDIVFARAGHDAAEDSAMPDADLVLDDPQGRLREHFGLRRGSGCVLVRPDQHVAARWLTLDASRLQGAVRRACGH